MAGILSNIWQGIKSIIRGGVKVVIGIGQAAWAMIKFAVKAVVWVVVGLFTMAVAGVEYVAKTISDFFTPKEIVVIPPTKVGGDLLDFINRQVEEKGAAVDDEVLEIIRKCETAEENNEAIMVARGTDENGDAALADPIFVKADRFEKAITDAENNDQIYIKRVKVA